MGAGISFRSWELSVPKTEQSLRDFDSIPDRIRQHRQADRRGILVVEGPSDDRLISRITNSRWAVFIAGNRNEVLATISGTQALKVERTAGLIDRDFDDVVDQAQSEGLPVHTFDEADLEAALVVLPVFNSLIEEFGSEKKIQSAGGPEGLRATAIGIAAVVGRVRRANAARGWGIDFDKLDFCKKVDSRKMELSVSRFVDAVLPWLPSPDEKEYFRNLAKEFEPKAAASGVMFRGRDALHVVRVGLQRKYGSSSISDTEDIARSLRLAATAELLSIAPFPALEISLSPTPETQAVAKLSA